MTFVETAIIAGLGFIGVLTTILASVIGYLWREVSKNAAFRKWFTGEDTEGHDGEIREFEATFTEIREELEADREERRNERERLWRGILSLHEGLRNLAKSIRSADEIEADPDVPEHPYTHRRLDGGERTDREEGAEGD